MPRYYENEEIPLPIVRRSASDRDIDALDDDERSQSLDISAPPRDRMRPGPSGGIAGLFAGAAALGVVQAMNPAAILGPIMRVAAERDVHTSVALGIAYGTAAASGALVGAVFAIVTRYLRRWLPLLVWALVFFVSLTMLLLAVSTTYGRGLGVAIAPAILAASAAFGVVVSFSLPIRRRG